MPRKTKTRTVYVTRKTRRKKPSMTLPLAATAPVAFIGLDIVDNVRSMGAEKALQYAVMNFSGYNVDTGDFKTVWLKRYWMPLIAGGLAHKAASKLGINRALSSAGVPFLRI